MGVRCPNHRALSARETQRCTCVSTPSTLCFFAPKIPDRSWEFFQNARFPQPAGLRGPCRSQTFQTSQSSPLQKTSTISLPPSPKSRRRSPSSTQSQMCCGRLALPNTRQNHCTVCPPMPHAWSERSQLDLDQIIDNSIDLDPEYQRGMFPVATNQPGDSLTS